MERCKSIYAVVLYAHWGVREYKWTGKWGKNSHDKSPTPIVWHYNDHNGTYEEYQRIPIEYTTTGYIITWTFDKASAKRLVTVLNDYMNRNLRLPDEEV